MLSDAAAATIVDVGVVVELVVVCGAGVVLVIVLVGLVG